MKRIQRKRTKGWKMPLNTVYVGRPNKWGNPFTDMKDAYDRYRVSTQLMRRPYSELGYNSKTFVDNAIKELKGKNLACWCSLDQSCHADILLEIANLPTPKRKVKEKKK